MLHTAFRTCFVPPVLATAVMLSGCGGSGNVRTTSGDDTAPVPFVAGVDRVFSSARTNQLTDDGMTNVARTEDGWNLTVDGNTVDLVESDLGAHPKLRDDMYFKELGNNEVVVFWSEENSGFEGEPADFEYLDVYGFAHHHAVPGTDLSTFERDDFVRADFIYLLDGTPTDDMPISGTADYVGRVRATEWRNDAAVLSGDTTFYRGKFALTAIFDADGAAVSGAFSELQQFTGPQGSRTAIPGTIPFATTVDGNQLSLSGASIDAGHFSGYGNIGIRAAFFGPAAAEVGGVFEGDNPAANTILHGYFAGTKKQ